MQTTEYHPLSTNDESLQDLDPFEDMNKLHIDMTDNPISINLDFEKFSLPNEIENGNSHLPIEIQGEGISIGNDKPFPISRPPTKPRDGLYAVAFMLHFIFILLLSLAEQNSLKATLLNYERAGSLSSIVMIVTLLGSFFGAVLAVFIIGGYPNAREQLLQVGLYFSIIAKICLGNVLLLTRSKYSLLGVAILVSAVLDSAWFRPARESLGYSSALVQMSIDVTRQYGVGFFFACAAIISCQTCVLLWWGAFFIGLLTSASPGYADLVVLAMVVSLYWISQFFHMFLSFVVGGCVLWVFLRAEGEQLDPTARILLYMQCALSTSLGSLCKAALLAPVAHAVLAMGYWADSRPASWWRCCPCSCNSLAALLSCCPAAGLSLAAQAQRHHRLSLCLCAAYGRTLCRAAEDHVAEFPETLTVSMQDYTDRLLKSTALEAALLLAVLLALCVERSKDTSWALVAFVCFCLSYSGLSLCVHVYCSAVDSLIVAAALCPERFAKQNQIVFLRFLRNSESALR